MNPNAKNGPQPASWARAGAWLFKRRTWIPLPLAIALLGIPAGQGWSNAAVVLGILTIVAGESLRLWAVRHIGVISRTRSERLGPMVGTGPFALVRNPLYLGNIALWVGFALAARLVWLVPVFIAVLGLEYHAIVRWEEQRLESRYAEEYRDYAALVPRWVPTIGAAKSIPPPAQYSWSDTCFSERGTLIAIVVGCLLLWVKSHF